MNNKQQPKQTLKKTYAKPVVQKHKPVAAISGSSDSSEGCLYGSRNIGNTYYH